MTGEAGIVRRVSSCLGRRGPAYITQERGDPLASLITQQPGHEDAERWTGVPGYEGIVATQMVVAAIHSDADRGERRRITVLAADLTDPRDPGTRKAVRRIVRDFKRGG